MVRWKMKRFKTLFTLFLTTYLVQTSAIEQAASQGRFKNHKIEREIFENDDNKKFHLFNMRDELKLSRNVKINTRLASEEKWGEFVFIDKKDSKNEIWLNGKIDREELCPDQQLLWLEKMHDEKDKKVEELKLEGKLEACELRIIFYVTQKGKRSRDEYIVELNLKITDVNDNLPSFIDDTKILRIRENTQAGRNYKLPSANDPDLPPNQIQSYQIAEADREDVKDFFRVKITRNKVDGSIIPKLVLKKSLDREQREEYQFDLVARDGDPKHPGEGSMRIKVKVIDENDNEPKFVEINPVVNIDETAIKDQLIYTVKATDNDLNSKITYRIDPNTKVQDRRLFKINAETGDIRMKKDLARSKLQTYVRHLYITAVDGDDEGTQQENTLSVTIIINAKNNNKPKITVRYAGESDEGIYENADTSKTLAIVTAQDPDGNKVGVALSPDAGDDSALFELKDVRKFSDQSLYSLSAKKTSLHFDREKKDVYKITLVATDKGHPPQTTIQNFTIRILDRNDEQPVFAKKLRTFQIKETQSVGKLPIAKPIRATDADIGAHAKLSYTFVSPAKVFYVVKTGRGVAAVKEKDVEVDSEEFPIHVDANSGDLILKSMIDAEKIRKLEVDVEASDPEHKATQRLRFNIMDVNEHKPVFTKSKYEFKVEENDEFPAGKAGTKIIGRVQAVDADRDANVIYEIIPPKAYRNGAKEFPFFLETDGAIKTKAKQQLDREQKPNYNFKVRALDADRKINKGLIGMAQVVVSITDSNDNAPKLCQHNRKYCVTSEDKVTVIQCSKPAKETVVNIDAVDYDEGFNKQLIYKVMRQRRKWANKDAPDVGLFSFDAEKDKSAMILSRDLAESDVGPYIVDIEVADAGIPPKRVQATVKIYINSVRTPLNETESGLTFTTPPSGLTRMAQAIGTNLRSFNKYLQTQGIDGVAQILIAACAVALLILFCIACIYIARRRCTCCCCYAGDKNDETDEDTGYPAGTLTKQTTGRYDGNFQNGQYSAHVLDYPEVGQPYQYQQHHQSPFVTQQISTSATPLLHNGGGDHVGTFGKQHNQSSSQDEYQMQGEASPRALQQSGSSQPNQHTPQTNSTNFQLQPASVDNYNGMYTADQTPIDTHRRGFEFQGQTTYYNHNSNNNNQFLEAPGMDLRDDNSSLPEPPPQMGGHGRNGNYTTFGIEGEVFEDNPHDHLGLHHTGI